MISIADAWAIVEHDPKFNTEGITLGRPLDFRDEGQSQLIMEGFDGLPQQRVTLWPTEGGELIASRWNQVGSAQQKELRHRVRFQIVVLAIMEAYEQHNSEEIARQREEREREIVRAKEAADARANLLKEREERLLHEHVGDQVRVRMRGEQSLHGAYIEAQEIPDGSFRVTVTWMKDSNYGKPFNLTTAKLLDVKVGSRYCELWNDGEDDLLYYEADKVRAKRTKVKPLDRV